MLDLDTMLPIREGILQRSPPRLIGSVCDACGARSFPVRAFCLACGQDALDSVPLSITGSVFSYTVVHQAPGQRPVPYVLAYVDLDDEVRVLAQVDHPPGDMRIGLRVGLVLRNIVPEPGVARLGYAFASLPTPISQEAP